ncbi:MAG: hypothetical protein V4463_16295 [Pseudomonadota bacterium]
MSGPLKTYLAAHSHGVWVDGGTGDDIITGTAFSDNFRNGTGNSKIDGGANGAAVGQGQDTFEITVANQAAMDAVTIAPSDLGGYTWMVTYGTGQKDYLTNIEAINININGGAGKWIPLAVNVGEIQDTSTASLNNSMHYAWANGTAFGDTFNADTDITSATRTLMTNHGRGVWVDLGAGDDTVTGSGFGDNIAVGSGTNRVDGGANAGSPPWGGKAEDVLQVTVASQAAADAVTVALLAGSVVQADIDAANAGYTHKVTAGSEIDYIKNIERVSVQIASGSGTTFGRDIPLTINVREADLSDANIANFYHLAWVNGTGGADTIDLSGNTALLSGPLKTYMAAHSHGLWVDGGTGDDIITGTAFSDNFRNGAGNSKIDGGANGAAVGQGQDVFEITVASQAEMDAITVAPSDLGGYTWMVTYGGSSVQKDYLTNIEAINVNINGGAGKWIPLAVNVGEIQDTSTASLNNSMHYAWANGTAFGDTFNADTDITSATRTLMTNHGRGVWVDLGAGDDTVTGSGFGDNIAVGSGTNRVDGGANAGSPPWGGKAEDVLQVTVASQAAADALTVVPLAGSVVQADIDAANAGYTHKVTAGSEIDYIKNIERVSVQIASGSGTTFGRDIPLTINVREADLSDANIANFYHLAWINGTGGADTIDLSGNTALLSSPLKTYMAAHSHGVWVDGGTGNDIITGTAFSDNFRNGAGNSKIDGGANASSVGQGQDVFEITVANQAEMDAITIAPSDIGGYTWMVTYGGASVQKDYLTNIEAINVNINGGAGKWIPLAINVSEIQDTSTNNLNNSLQYAWVNGTAQGDTFNANTDISQATRDLMAAHGRGVYVDLGAGDDTVVGSAFGDNITVGTGVNRVDGGANGGVPPGGGKALDSLDVYATSSAAASAVTVTELTAASTGADATAFTAGYLFKVANGNETDYVKNIEQINIQVWTDKDGDGQRDYAGPSDPANEVSFVRTVSTAANSAPSFNGGAMPGLEVLARGMERAGTPPTSLALADGKTLVSGSHRLSDTDYQWALTRLNADGSLDTSFGGGSGQVSIDNHGGYAAGAPQLQGDGKIVLALTSVGDFDAGSADFRIVRVNADGSPDTGFGSNGMVLVAVGPGRDRPNAVQIQGDGKILVAGSSASAIANNRDFGVVRLNADGSLDTSFNGTGKLLVPVGPNNDFANAMALQDDGAIIVAGSSVVNGFQDFSLTRLSASGALDTSFGSAGKVIVSLGTQDDVINRVLVQSDGKILAAGVSNNGADNEGAIVRFNANGTLDTSFGSGGKVVLHLSGGPDTFNDALVQSDGKILLSGSIGNALGVVRLNTDGSFDVTFGDHGLVRLPVHGLFEQGGTLSLRGDGHIQVVGVTANNDQGSSSNTVVLRLNPDGTLDTGFAASPVSTLGEATVVASGLVPVVLDRDVAVSDTQLNALGNYGGATVTVARHAGANADDHFSASGDVSINGGVLTVGGVAIGTVSQASGTLVLTFDTHANQGMVNRAMHGIAYTNSSDAPPSTLTLDWTFSDGNTGAQGFGGAQTAQGSTTVSIALQVQEVHTLAWDASRTDQLDPNTQNGKPLAGTDYFAEVHGTARGDTFNAATDISAPTRALMTQYGRGVAVDLGGGDDTAVGTALGDVFAGGSGTNRIDGGANGGVDAQGSPAVDTLAIFVTSQTAAEAVAATQLSGASTGDDLAAFNAGYVFKVVSGSEVDYIKNIEEVQVLLWNDKNGDGQRTDTSPTDPANEVTFARGIALHANSAPSFGPGPGIGVYALGTDFTVSDGTLLANGKMLVSARFSSTEADTDFSWVLARVNADGALDTSFGAGSGYVTIDRHGGDTGIPPVVQGDGKILMALSSTDGANTGTSDFRVMRFNADGSPDTGFGTAGTALIPVGPGRDRPNDISLLDNGKIFVAGSSSNGVDRDYSLVKLNADGSLDTSFNGTGKLLLPMGSNNDFCNSLLVQADGKMVLGGSAYVDGHGDFGVARLNADGTLDSSFGNGGKLILSVGVDDTVNRVIAQADGKLLVVGYTQNGSDSDGIVLRLNANGSLDTSFANNGKFTLAITPGSDILSDVHLQSDGKIVLAGTTGGSHGEDSDLAVLRLNADGSPDATFGALGMVRLPVQGIGSYAQNLQLLPDGRIAVFGGTSTDSIGSGAGVIARFNADGSPDASFNPQQPSSLDVLPVHGTGFSPVVLNLHAAVIDAELAAHGSYGGATLTLARQGQANAEDVFLGTGDPTAFGAEVSFANGTLKVGSVVIGTASQSAGTLVLTFNEAATQGMVNRAMHGIAYTNASSTPPASVTLDWTFSDGNSGGQGFGAALSTHGSSSVSLGVLVEQIALQTWNSGNAFWGQPLAQVQQFAWIGGTAGNDSIDGPSLLSSATLALMAQYQRGIYFYSGPGDDTLLGSAYDDMFVPEGGTNRIDGGANLGVDSGGSPNQDIVRVDVTTAEQAAAVVAGITQLTAEATGADGTAFAAGYRFKVANGNETDYLKNVEMVRVRTLNNDQVVATKDIQIAVKVGELNVDPNQTDHLLLGGLTASQLDFAFAFGTPWADTFNANTDVSAFMRGLMDSYQRGVHVELFGGGDTAVGSAYGDDFVSGGGTNFIDGGTQLGLNPQGNKAQDVLNMFVANQAQADAVTVTRLDSGASGADATARDAGYQFKLVNGSGIDYVKNIEQFNIQIWNDANNNGQRNGGEVTFAKGIPLVMRVNEIIIDPAHPDHVLNGPALADQMQFAFAAGTPWDDSFNAATSISSATLALMNSNQRGAFADLGAGNDTFVGSAFGDNVIPGAGTNMIDGGTNLGTQPNGNPAFDAIDLYVPNQQAANAVNASVLDGTGSAADIAAFGNGYLYKLISGAETDYVKNIEQVNVQIWNDANTNGQRDNGEVAYARAIHLGIVVSTAQPDPNNPGHDKFGTALANYGQLAWVYGSPKADTFDAVTGLPAAAQALMTTYQRGVFIELEGGNDTVVGSAFGDDINLGTGTNFADGGTNLGTFPWGGKAQDTLEVYVTSQTQANAVTVTKLDGSATGADATARDAGYLFKIANGAETDYVKNIESANVQLWNDANGNGQRDQNEVTFAKGIPLVLNVNEIVLDPEHLDHVQGGGLVADQMHFAWANGTPWNDSFNAATDVSAATLALMDTYQRGLFGELFGGDDTFVGSAYGDNVVPGAGTNMIDGGTNLGHQPNGNPAVDIIDLYLTTQQDINAVTAVALDGTGSAADIAAFGNGYQFKVVAGSEIDYTKGIEQVNIQLWNDANHNGQRDPDETTGARGIALAMQVNTIQVDPLHPDHDTGGNLLSSDQHFAWVAGSPMADSFNAATDVPQATRTLMDTYQRGLFAEMGAGNDTVVGSAYGDDFTPGEGTNFVDGGNNLGTFPNGNPAQDTVQVYVSSQTQANAVTVAKLDGSATGADATAFGNGYQFKVVNGSEIDYLKNVESFYVQLWNDANGNHQRDNGEVTLVKPVQLALTVNEIALDPNNPGHVQGGGLISEQMHFAWANGSQWNDSFNAATDVSSATLALMAANQRGLFGDLGAGDDTFVGSAYGDNVIPGLGTNYIDGGTNLGAQPFGGAALDVLEIYVANQAAVNAITSTVLNGSGSAADIAAFNNGYQYKIVAGSETDYVKNVELVSVQIWNDLNGNGQRDYGGEQNEVTPGRTIFLAMQVNELQVDPAHPDHARDGDLLSDHQNFVWVDGTQKADTFSAANNISAPTLALMDTYQRGLSVDLGAGDDAVTGSAYGDDFTVGAGTNTVNGGSNLGISSWGDMAQDTLQVYVPDQTGANAVQAVLLTNASTGSDATAFSQGFQFKVVAGAEIDYVQNIENVSIQIWNDANGNGQRDYQLGEVNFARGITLGLGVNLAHVDPANPNHFLGGQSFYAQMHYAWAAGGPLDDAVSTANISAAQLALMAANGRGYYAEMGAGNDTITGSNFGDNLNGGSGTNYVDGGSNLGVNPNGDEAQDVLDVIVTSQGVADGATLTALTGTLSGADAAAQANGYAYKFVAGSETDYLKSMEGINIQLWTDLNSDGMRQYSNDASNEVIGARWISLAPTLDTAPTPVLTGTTEGAANPAGTSVASLIADGSISNLLGTLPEAIVIESVDTSMGRWQYSFDNGTSWLTVRSEIINASDGSGLTLGANALLRVLPFGDANGTATMNFRAWDASGGTPAGSYIRYNPGSGSVSGQMDTASLSVAAVNDAPTFAPGNGVSIDVLGVDHSAERGVVLANGKLLMLGYLNLNAQTPDYHWMLTRMNGDGSLDTSYGSGGRVDLGSNFNLGFVDMKTEGDGKVVLAMSTLTSGNENFKVMRVNGDGSPDTSFGGSGTVVVAVGAGLDEARGLAIQADGKILVSGQSDVNGNRDISLVRLNADGSLDATFGKGNGKLILPVGVGADVAASVLVQGDGRITLTGSANNGSNDDVAIVRLTPDGNLDTSFAAGAGKLTLPIGSANDRGFDSALQTDGKLLVLARTSTSGNNDFAVLRFNEDGTPDTSFGTAGKVIVPVSAGQDIPQSMVIGNDGHIYVSGSIGGNLQTNLGAKLGVLRLNTDGSVDTTFGNNGVAYAPLEDSHYAYSGKVTIAPDGKIVVFGFSAYDDNFNGNLAVARFNHDGTPDRTFHPDGDTLGLSVMHSAATVPVPLDPRASLFDAEMSAAGNYAGGTMTVSRHGGASVDDHFGGSGNVSFTSNQIQVGDVVIGSVVQVGGALTLNFNSSATRTLMNQSIDAISYTNSGTEPASLQMDWSFSDTLASATGSTTIVTGATGSAVGDAVFLAGGNETFDGGAGEDTAIVYWHPSLAGDAVLSSAKVINGDTTVITVSQTQTSVVTPLLTLTHTGAGTDWTIATFNAGADALIHGSDGGAIGIDHISNIENFLVLLETPLTIGTGGISNNHGFEVTLIGS